MSRNLPFLFCFNLQVYCLMTEGQGWTLLARFSNTDDENWKKDSSWWKYNKKDADENGANPVENEDMISPAFWLVGGNEFMITRSDDPYTALLQTTDDCLGEQTFRDKIHKSSDGGGFKDQCRSSCNVTYGGQYRETDGFEQADKNGSCSPVNLQTGNKIGFWCNHSKRVTFFSKVFNWTGNYYAVMMIGAGGDGCSRVDHGIGIMRKSSFHAGDRKGKDFSNAADVSPTKDYSLNLWVH